MGAGHDHSNADTRVSRMVIAAAILTAFFVLELTTALLINSLALLSDAGHMLTDLVAMFMGLTAVLLARHGSASPARTYGWHRAEVFTAVANAVLLLGVAAFILYEAVERLGDAPDIPGVPMIVVALAGLVANAVVVLLLRSHSKESLAVKGAYMEVVADTVGSIGVLIAGIVTVTTRWPYADVVVAVFVALWVLPRAISLARAALRILSESSPTHIDVEELRTALCAVEGVTEVHDLHVWTLVPGKDMVTAHLTSSAEFGAGARRRPCGAHRARAGPRNGSGGAARRRRRLQVRSASDERLGEARVRSAPPDRSRRADPGSADTRRSRRWRRRPAPTRPRSAGTRGWARGCRAPGRSPSIRCGATDPGRGDSRCGHRRRR